MSIGEAKKILDLQGVDESDTHPSELGQLWHQRFTDLAEANSPLAGGSQYLGAKLVAARQTLEKDYLERYGQPLLGLTTPEINARLRQMGAEAAKAQEKAEWEARERAHQLRVKKSKHAQALRQEELAAKKRGKEEQAE
jgi:hypothetical protein